MVGLSHTSFWLHWIITGAVFSAITTLSLEISGLSCQFGMFLNTAFPISFMMFFTFSFCMVCFAFFLSTIIKTTKVAYTISYAFVLFGVLLELMLSNALLLYFVFFNDKSDWVATLLKVVFYMYPPFAFSILYGIVSRKASTHFDDSQWAFIEGKSFGWADLNEPEIGEFSQGDSYQSPTPLNCFGMLFLVMTIYGILTWYFDHVIGDNRGTNESFYFFLTKKYWQTWRSKKSNVDIKKRRRLQKQRDRVCQLDEILKELNDLDVVDSVQEETQKVM